MCGHPGDTPTGRQKTGRQIFSDIHYSISENCAILFSGIPVLALVLVLVRTPSRLISCPCPIPAPARSVLCPFIVLETLVLVLEAC